MELELREETKKALAALGALLVMAAGAVTTIYLTLAEMIRAIDGE